MSGKVSYIKEHVVLGTTPPNPDTGYTKVYQKTDGLWYTLDSAGTESVLNWELLKPIIISQPAISIHNEPVANATTNIISQNITFPFDGDYVINISYNWNSSATGNFVKVYSTLGGNALDLNDRATDPQGNNQIMNLRANNSGNSSSGAITGTGSGNKFHFNMPFIVTNKTGGSTETFTLDISSQNVSTESAIWNVLIRVEPINLN